MRGTVRLEQEQDPAPIRPNQATEHRRIGILWACCWYFDTEWLIGLMTQKKKGSRSCLDMFMRVPSLAANHPVRGDTSAHHIFVCGHPDLNWSILNVRVLALTHGDDIRSSLWGGCIPLPGSS